MTTIKIANMISQRASMLSKEHLKKLDRGEIKNVLKELGVNSIKKPNDYNKEQWDTIRSRIIWDKWNNKGIKKYSQNDIKNNL